MNLLVVSKYQFTKKGGKLYGLPAFGQAFWQKYLDVFDNIRVLGIEVKGYLNNGTLSEYTDSRISVEILPDNSNPKDFKNDGLIKKILKYEISKVEAVLIKPSARKGMMGIEVCKELNVPYMVELTGDLNLTLKNHPSILKRLYGPIIHRQIRNAIKDCKFGLYVTKEYLQKVYPIEGEMCGCTDTIIPDPVEDVLERRINYIRNKVDNVYKIGIVASYHDSRKGIDTAIKALNILSNSNIELHILGLGTEDDREKWFHYARKYDVEKQIFFDPSLSGVEKVLEWNDNMDLNILPSRSEGLPRCVVESISRACPCIVTNVCGMTELVDVKWQHNPGDYKKLAQLIAQLICDKQLMEAVAKENFERSKEYKFELLRARRNEFLNRFKDYCENYKNKKNESINS